jgi:hypothetical protein
MASPEPSLVRKLCPRDGHDLIRTRTLFLADVADDEIEVADFADAHEVFTRNPLGGGEDHRLDAQAPPNKRRYRRHWARKPQMSDTLRCDRFVIHSNYFVARD